MSPLGLTSDCDLEVLFALTDVEPDAGCCPICIVGHLTRPDDIHGDHAVPFPFQVCEACGGITPDEEPEF